jgi:hypothetical protein
MMSYEDMVTYLTQMFDKTGLKTLEVTPNDINSSYIMKLTTNMKDLYVMITSSNIKDVDGNIPVTSKLYAGYVYQDGKDMSKPFAEGFVTDIGNFVVNVLNGIAVPPYKVPNAPAEFRWNGYNNGNM